MIGGAASMWPQPLAPLHSLVASALVAAVPLAVVLVLMGILRRSGLFAAACGLAATIVLALGVWRMPPSLAGWSVVYGFGTALWSILWLVFNALWLYNLSVHTGSFDRLRVWIQQHASGDACIQATLVAFCLGALLEGSAGFGAPVAITAFLLVGVGFQPRRAVLVSLLANTAPVAFGGVGVPIVALANVTGLDLMKLSATVGRQLPLLSLFLPAYLMLVVEGWPGLRRAWPVALVAGSSFAGTQFLVSNTWGPAATDILSALASIAATVTFLRLRPSRPPQVLPDGSSKTRLSLRDVVDGWLPWAGLALVIGVWSFLNVAAHGEIVVAIPGLNDGVLVSATRKPFPALFRFAPLATGTAVLATTAVTALWFRVSPRSLADTAIATLRQLRLSGLTVLFILGLAQLYNYSGMVYTLASALAGVGAIFPLVSSYLGWVACFLTGSDTSSNILFGNLQVATAHELHLDPVLMAATNSSGAVAGKMISPQNIAVGVTTVGLVGHEGDVLRSTFWHSVLFATFIGLIALAQAYLVSVVP